MSQKPRAGMPARPAAAPRTAGTEMVSSSGTDKAAQAAEIPDTAMEDAARAHPAPAEPAGRDAAPIEPLVQETQAAPDPMPDSARSPTAPFTPPQGLNVMMKSTEDFVAFGQANMEAFMRSGQIWAAGMQELTKQIASTAKASLDEAVSTFKAISTAKSFKEAIELQSGFAKTSIEKAMVESNKLTDASIRLTEQTLAPITARVTVAVETFGKAA